MSLPPEMFIIAGPPGAGKSTSFSVSLFADRISMRTIAQQLNDGSYHAIPPLIRQRVNAEFEAFMRSGIAAGNSFALETTLRRRVTFEQARLAKSVGFRVRMTYVALDTFERHLERVTRRATAGGHSASEATLRRIYDSSLANLPAATRPVESGVDVVRIYSNSVPDGNPRLVLHAKNGGIVQIAPELPAWLQTALQGSESAIAKIRSEIATRNYSLGA